MTDDELFLVVDRGHWSLLLYPTIMVLAVLRNTAKLCATTQHPSTNGPNKPSDGSSYKFDQANFSVFTYLSVSAIQLLLKKALTRRSQGRDEHRTCKGRQTFNLQTTSPPDAAVRQSDKFGFGREGWGHGRPGSERRR